MCANAIDKIWAGVYGFWTATASWFHSNCLLNSSKTCCLKLVPSSFYRFFWMSSSSSSAYSVIRWVNICRHVTFVKPMIWLNSDLWIFSGINWLMNLLHAQLTALYLLNKRNLCLWVHTSSDKIVVVGAWLGMTRWIPGFYGRRKGVQQWVINAEYFAVRTR